MSEEKAVKQVRIKNQLELWIFCAVIGAVAGALVWTVLKIMAVGMEILWEWMPERVSMPFYTVLICTAGAALVGIVRKKIWRLS